MDQISADSSLINIKDPRNRQRQLLGSIHALIAEERSQINVLLGLVRNTMVRVRVAIWKQP